MFYKNQWVTVTPHTQYSDLRQGAVHSQMHEIHHPGYKRVQVDYVTDGAVVVKAKRCGEWQEDIIAVEFIKPL